MREHTRKLPIRHIVDNSPPIAEKVDDLPLQSEEVLKLLYGDEPRSAVLLRGLRYREGLTQTELGNLLGIAQTNISLMEHGKRSIGKKIAKRLAELFKTDYRLFL